MPITNIISKVKKIDIQNKVIGEDWKQTITLTLGEIELKNENLIALRQFRPNEEVLVNLKSLQLSLGDIPEEQKGIFLDRDTDVAPVPEAPREVIESAQKGENPSDGKPTVTFGEMIGEDDDPGDDLFESVGEDEDEEGDVVKSFSFS